MGFKKPKAPPPTAQELELERKQRGELDELTREKNERLKAIKRRQRGRRTLLGVANRNDTSQGIGGGGVRSGSRRAGSRGRGTGGSRATGRSTGAGNILGRGSFR